MSACAGAGEAESLPVKFGFRRNDVVVFTGGANVVAAQENAYLETILTLSLPTQRIRFRNMGWEGDTVFEQRRDLNFGPWSQQFDRIGATVIFAQFGQMESLQGKDSLDEFIRAYDRLLDEFARRTGRIVLVSPAPFENARASMPDLSQHNIELRQFVEAIRTMALRRGYPFLDLFTPFEARLRKDRPMSSDGLSLNAYGHWIIAREIAQQLGFDVATSVLSPGSAEHLRQLILTKNRYWFNYWRPMNWAFLHGDRTEQPSSRDHRDPNIRWFPVELEKFTPLIEKSEQEIATQANRRE